VRYLLASIGFRNSTRLAGGVVCALFYSSVCAAGSVSFDEEIEVVVSTPVGGVGLPAAMLPFNVQVADQYSLERSQSLDLADHLGTHFGSVSINSGANNPLQADVQYRGYSASPLLGLPMGIAVYQNGARINEPLGDAVNWDLIPESAVHSMILVGGSNPLFGRNALGGALSIEMKDGFNFFDHQMELIGGSWERLVTNIESGSNNGTFGYYLNLHYFDEEGWRALSDSDAANVFASFSYRAEKTKVDLSFQYGDTELTGNGPAPIALLKMDRDAIFTAPDTTENELNMFTLNASHEFSDVVNLDVTGFHRRNETVSFNGDISEFSTCNLTAGTVLVEGLTERLLTQMSLDTDDVCTNNSLGVTDSEALEIALNALVLPGSKAFNLEDHTSGLSGTGVITDDAVNNISRREQKSYGMDWQLAFQSEFLTRENFLIVGVDYFGGDVEFNSVLELSNIDPITRSTRGMGVGSFVQEGATMVSTSSDSWSAYFLESIRLADTLTLTVGGRYNYTTIELRDRSGVRPELNGDHSFSRFNPSLGLTYRVSKGNNVFLNYSESSRVPTPIELSCNESVFQQAQNTAVERGDDPSDVQLECRLPNAFLADPPLKEVIARSFEVGIRTEFNSGEQRVGYFRTVNKDDIIFQATGRATGLFANVDRTKHEGIEASLSNEFRKFDMVTAYTYIVASYEADFLATSPEHPLANGNGEISVNKGDRIPGVPRHQFKFNLTYSSLRNIRMGGEMIYNSSRVLRGDESNQLGDVDGYVIFNLRTNYTHNRRFEFFIRVTNLLDKDYENFGLLGEDPSDALPSISSRSPIFLGAGAPRGVWAGIRVRL